MSHKFEFLVGSMVFLLILGIASSVYYADDHEHGLDYYNKTNFDWLDAVVLNGSKIGLSEVYITSWQQLRGNTSLEIWGVIDNGTFIPNATAWANFLNFSQSTTDDLTEGSTNLYDNVSWNESVANDKYLASDGSTPLTGNWNTGVGNITLPLVVATTVSATNVWVDYLAAYSDDEINPDTSNYYYLGWTNYWAGIGTYLVKTALISPLGGFVEIGRGGGKSVFIGDSGGNPTITTTAASNIDLDIYGDGSGVVNVESTTFDGSNVVVPGKISATDWTDVIITESQISNLVHTVDGTDINVLSVSVTYNVSALYLNAISNFSFYNVPASLTDCGIISFGELDGTVTCTVFVPNATAWAEFLNSSGKQGTYAINTSSTENIFQGITIQVIDSSDPTLTFDTTQHQIKVFMDEDANNDNLHIDGQTLLNDTQIVMHALDGERARILLYSGAANYGVVMYGAADDLYLINAKQDNDIVFQVNDGGVTKTITWDASTDTLEHSKGIFNFNDDDLVTTGNLGDGTNNISIAQIARYFDNDTFISNDTDANLSSLQVENNLDVTNNINTTAGNISIPVGKLCIGDTNCSHGGGVLIDVQGHAGLAAIISLVSDPARTAQIALERPGAGGWLALVSTAIGGTFLFENTEEFRVAEAAPGSRPTDENFPGTTVYYQASSSLGNVFNNLAGDIDLRVESDDHVYAFFIDAGNNRVGLFTFAPSASLDVWGNMASALTGTVTASFGSAAIVGSGTSFTTELNVGDAIKIETGAAPEIFTVSAIADNTHLTLDSAYQGFGGSGLDAWTDDTLLEVNTGDNANKVIVTKTGYVGINTASPTYPLEVNANASNISLYLQAQGISTNWITHSYTDKSYSGDYLSLLPLPTDNLDERGRLVDIFPSEKIFYEVTDYSRPETKKYIVEECEEVVLDSHSITSEECSIVKDNIVCQNVTETVYDTDYVNCTNIIKERTFYPHKKIEEGDVWDVISFDNRLLISELKQENLILTDCILNSKDFTELKGCI